MAKYMYDEDYEAVSHVCKSPRLSITFAIDMVKILSEYYHDHIGDRLETQLVS
ncbi:hypothetical protein [Candidatus Aquarickettsia rohweri]|uniref:hypothetical protein n=1 Tax=Candidatus Aquarickettsia rohweri TaxID=2602574 RepID=UPI0012B64AF2|nr:hypothetical protein [Candidatus Aquarickettsia rohweri]